MRHRDFFVGAGDTESFHRANKAEMPGPMGPLANLRWHTVLEAQSSRLISTEHVEAKQLADFRDR